MRVVDQVSAQNGRRPFRLGRCGALGKLEAGVFVAAASYSHAGEGLGPVEVCGETGTCGLIIERRR